MIRRDGCYLTPRGYVAPEDLTLDEVAYLAPVFWLRDAALLTWEGIAVLAAALGLDVVAMGRGAIVGRYRGRR
jgi:hypothetical protein